MKIELDKDDILNYIKENHWDDINLIIEIIDKNTNSWESIRRIIEELSLMLKRNGEMHDIIERINQQN